MQDLSFWKLPFHRYVNERTQLSKSKWWLKKKKKTVFQEARLHLWQSRLARAGRSMGSELLLFDSAPTLPLHIKRHDPLQRLLSGSQEDGHILWNLRSNPHLLRPYLYNQKSNPKPHPKPTPRPARVRWDISRVTAGTTTQSRTILKEIKDNKKQDPSPLLVQG